MNIMNLLLDDVLLNVIDYDDTSSPFFAEHESFLYIQPRLSNQTRQQSVQCLLKRTELSTNH